MKRTAATRKADAMAFSKGDKVEIVSGPPRQVGNKGTVTRAGDGERESVGVHPDGTFDHQGKAQTQAYLPEELRSL